jgi:hypothetical protein
MKLIKNPFNDYGVTYGIVSNDTVQFKDYARIDFYSGAKKVGQMLFGSSIAPGNNGGIVNGDEIDLFFPLSHFTNIIKLLRLEAGHALALYLEMDEVANAARMGGIILEAQIR